MRIQHNITAMNSYRNYSANTRAVSKNLEKLSSGYRINRAGDDAAGLAISEKMRAQLAGLEQAQTNAKSGINLVQTAEGAMTEIHDMLNRMVTLAEQSANGTYDNEVDRAQLQKELVSLKAEIDRIADSANYNGIKLLDGSLDGEDKITVKDTTFTGLAEALYGPATATQIAENTGGNVFAIPPQFDGTTQGWAQMPHKDGIPSSRTTFEVDLSNLTLSSLGNGGTTTFELGLASSDKTTWLNTDNHHLVSGDDSVDKVGGATDSSTWSATITADREGNVSGEKLATELVKALGATTTVEVNGVEYNVTAEGAVLKFEMTETGFGVAATTPAKFSGNFNIGVKSSAGTISGMTDNSTSNIHMGSIEQKSQLADIILDYVATGDRITDGSGYKLGDVNYVFACSDETLNAKYDSTVKVIDIRDLSVEGSNGQWHMDNNIPVGQALSRLTEAAADNAMWSVELSSNGDTLCLREKETYSGGADLSTLKGLQAAAQHFTLANANVDVVKATGKALTLQIGDTAEDFNQMKVNVEDMHCKAMGIGDIDISTQEGAATAVNAIKAAVNYVSNTRGTMGALQNRLDHTINNLGVIQENIQDAEATIRDVDIAKEMMAYTKNNILVQSAQAMLTQANQLPQGVLQMLQG